jgi:hypothetical protein
VQMKYLAYSCVLALTLAWARTFAQATPVTAIQFPDKSAGSISFYKLPDVWHAFKFKAASGTVELQPGQVIGIAFGYDGASKLCSISQQAALDRIVTLDSIDVTSINHRPNVCSVFAI